MGGNAVKNVSRINQENISATLKTIYSKLLPFCNISIEDTSTFGSTGKKNPGGSSGDIDLGISFPAIMNNNRFDFKSQVFELLIDFCENYGLDYNYIKGLNIVSMAWPIKNVDGKQFREYVQVDLMPVDNIEYASWSMYSPFEKDSPYKSGVRNALLQAIAYYVNYKTLEKLDDKDITFERGYFNLTSGLHKFKQTYRSDKTQSVLNRKRTLVRDLITNNPDEVAKLFFGPEYNASDILTIDNAWNAFLSDSFPFKEKRKEIVKHAVEECQQKGFDYPSYMDEFLQSPINESLDTPRKPLLKIHQMNAKQFVDFLTILKRHMNGSKVNLSGLNTTEKVDGQAARILVMDGKIQIESSHSGVNKQKSLPREHSATLSYLKKNEKDNLLKIAKDNFTDFKLIGELFYLGDEKFIDKDGSVTFVATKYDSNKLGGIATFVIFDIKGIKDGALYDIDVDVRNNIIEALVGLSNKNFKFYSSKTFKWNKVIDIDLNYNTAATKEIFNDPTILLDRSNRELFVTFRTLIANAFSREIAKHGSVIGMDDTEVEGIVFDVEGIKYGATNFNWQEIKHKLFYYNDLLVSEIENFFKTVFGYVTKRKIKELLNEPDADIRYTIPYRKELPKLQEKISDIMEQVQNIDNIPKASWRTQLPHMIRRAKEVLSMKPDLNYLRQSLNK